MKLKITLALVTVLGLAASTLLSATLPKLPKDRPLPQSADSPGVVTFRHTSHVDEARPDCTVCHPKLFAILRTHQKNTAATKPASPITHADMEKGRSCGSCHDGQSAHGLDDCTTCHEPDKSEGAAPSTAPAPKER